MKAKSVLFILLFGCIVLLDSCGSNNNGTNSGAASNDNAQNNLSPFDKARQDERQSVVIRKIEFALQKNEKTMFPHYNNTVMKLADFKKTNGMDKNLMGRAVYELDYDFTLEFIQRGYIPKPFNEFFPSNYIEARDANDSYDNFVESPLWFNIGDKLEIIGAMSYLEKAENGWRLADDDNRQSFRISDNYKYRVVKSSQNTQNQSSQNNTPNPAPSNNTQNKSSQNNNRNSPTAEEIAAAEKAKADSTKAVDDARRASQAAAEKDRKALSPKSHNLVKIIGNWVLENRGYKSFNSDGSFISYNASGGAPMMGEWWNTGNKIFLYDSFFGETIQAEFDGEVLVINGNRWTKTNIRLN